MRENITEILQLAPYNVVQAATGKEGIELARQKRPDLILCDITMPDLDGFGVLHILGKDPALANVPFIFLTAKAEPADFRFGMNLGADDYLTKPFDDLTLLNTVELRLRKSERTQPEPVINPLDLTGLTRAILHTDDARQALCAYYPTMQYARRHRLFTAGGWPSSLYFISQGKVKLYKTDETGNEYITSLLGRGDFVGYLALLDEMAYGETAELLEDATVCTIPKADFLALIHTNQAVANEFISLLAGDVTEHQERLLKLAYHSVRKRVAEALLIFQRKFYPVGPPMRYGPAEEPSEGRSPDGSENENVSPPMTLSREDWAHLVGASTETVIRTLSDLKADGLIEITARHITLLDIEKLNLLKR